MASLARNTAFLTVAKMLNVAIYALFGLLLPRFVAVDVNGIYSFVATLMFFGSMAASFGIPLVLVRAVARDKSRAAELYVDARLAMGGGAVVSSLVMLLYVGVEGWLQGGIDMTVVHLVLLAGIILVADSLGSVGEAVFQAHERMVLPSLVEIATGLFRAGGALICLYWLSPLPRPEPPPPEHGLQALYGVFLCFIAGSVARGMVLPILARKRFLPGSLPKSKLRRAGRLLVESLGIALFRMLRTLRNRIDVLLLGLLLKPAAGLGLAETVKTGRGLYTQAFRVVMVFHTITQAFNTAIFPRMARLTKGQNQEEIRQKFVRVVRYQAWWSSPLAAVTFLFAPEVAGWFGPEYREGLAGLGNTAEVLRILVFAMLMDSLGGPVGMLLIGRPEMDRKLPWFGGALAATSVVLNLILIPMFGILGAAYASLGASLVELFTKVFLIRKFLGNPWFLVPGILPYLLLGAACTAAIVPTPLRQHPVLAGVAVAVLYFVTSLLLGLVDPAIRERLRRRLPF
ncbi:MAG: hypothetical protein DWQ01_10920 [Planctomycetota bacterium]|nr:MAG: hypothetical protein DWQ01_10920 [Planctomycetota bacterium]